MKFSNKKNFLFLIYIGLIAFVLGLNYKNINKSPTIEEIIETENYNNFSSEVKEFIKDYYEENGEVLLTEDNASEGESYLNPLYIEYLNSDHKEEYSVVPSITAYTPKIATSNETYPAKFDLRNVDGKNFVTPNKNQGVEGICWAYATVSLLETHDLLANNKSFDETASLFSEKQLDYALSTDGIVGGNKVVDAYRNLSTGASLNSVEGLLVERLGGVRDTWNTTNQAKIKNNEELEPYIVFDREEVIYEADETIDLMRVNYDLTNEELNQSIRSKLKSAIYNNGGVVVSIDINTVFKNYASPTLDYVAVYENHSGSRGQHALHIIGWDDNYNYEYCRWSFGTAGTEYINIAVGVDSKTGEKYCPEPSNGTIEKVTGTGAWIMKNSWGSSQSYVYLTYNSVIDEALIITKYSEKNWTNSYRLNNKTTYDYDQSAVIMKYSIGTNFDNVEKINKLKIYSSATKDFDLYYSEDGTKENLVLLGNYSFDYAGVKTIDLSDKEITVNKNSYFQTGNVYVSLFLFTSNTDDIKKAYTTDFNYDIENEIPSQGNKLFVDVKTELRNIDDGTIIEYKLKNSNGEYLQNDVFEVTNNVSYYGMDTPIIKINGEYAKKGVYTLETLYNSQVLSTSLINLEVDYQSIEGSGTADDPWQIKTTRHFNMIRKALNDNFILMNDLDFEHDTQNPNGIFYNSGKGFEAINYFLGNLDGNNKTLKNIKTSSGLFGYIISNKNTCKFDVCGIHDLKVDNLTYTIKNGDGSGGIINNLHNANTYKYNFSNLSAANITFIYEENLMARIANYEVAVGGIVGKLTAQEIADTTLSILKIDNWYSNFTYNGKSYKDYTNINYIGGLVGSVTGYSFPYLSINNSKANINLNIVNDSDTTYYYSDLVGNFYSTGIKFNINNSIGIVKTNFNDDSKIYGNAFVGFIKENSVNGIVINGALSTIDYAKNDIISITNYESGLKPYEFALANYDDINYYENAYIVYNEETNNTTKIAFKDRFNLYEKKIPTLKKYPEDYSEYYKNYSIKVGETKNITDLISKDTGYRKLNVYKSFECNLDVCNNVTDETIITIPSEENNYTFKGLTLGTTTLIVYDELSGYLDTVTIVVLNENEHLLNFDYNHDNLIGNSRVILKNATYGDLPILERDNYSFLGWFTDKLAGTKVESTDIFTANSDITLYAHWEINKYMVTFDSDGGSNIESVEVEYNNAVTKPSNPTKEGYTFKEWQLNGHTYDFSSKVTESVTLKAVYEINKYMVTFDSNGGSNIESVEVEYNNAVTKPSNPTKEGYTFKEWQLNGHTYDFSSKVTESITLKAVYEINKYIVTFDSNGGSNIESVEVEYNNAVTRPSNPTKEGYTFKEWQLNGHTYDFSSKVTESITLKAIWSKSSTTIAANDIPVSTYVIGKYVFTRNTNSSYDGRLTTRRIMLASRTLTGNTESEMIIYYKKPNGDWIDALSGDIVNVPTSFEIEVTDLDEVFNTSYNHGNTNDYYSSDVSTSTYIIGEYMFTRNSNSVYDGKLTTRRIMLASRTLTGNTESEMIIYYKKPNGAWIDAITGDTLDPLTTFQISNVDLTNQN